MTNSDVETMRAVIREELAPVMTRLDSLGGTIDTMRADLDTMRADLDAIRAYLDAVRPNIDGIPLLQQAISVMRHDMNQLREDMLVVSNTVLRLDRNRDYHDGTLHDILREMQAVHRQIASIASRVRKLEGVEE